jgi:hypothetical protein
VPDFNHRFTVTPAQPESAFTPIGGIDLDLLLSAKHERVVRNDNTVTFKGLILQLPTTPARMHFVRCPEARVELVWPPRYSFRRTVRNS